MSFFVKLWAQRLALLAKTSPGLYHTLILFLACIGYAYLLLFPLLAVSAVTFLGYSIYLESPQTWRLNDWLLAAMLVILTAASARISYVLYKTKPEQPAGKPLLADKFPVLLNRISELVTTYGAPEIHHVKLTTHFRTEIIRTPLTGFPSIFVNTLLIGLPVMSCMSPLHLKLLLARQIGHLARAGNSQLHHIVYLRNVWNIYLHHYSQTWKTDTVLLRLFFSWYAPFFHLSTLPAMRLETHIMDQCMLDITHQENAAEVIAAFSIKNHYLETIFWPEINASAYKIPRPACLPFSSMDSALSAALDPHTAQHIYEEEINRVTAADSETPNLMTRLKTLGYDEFVMPSSKKETAAHQFLGDRLSVIQKQLDNIWYLKNKNIWSRRYQQGVEEKKRLKILREQAAQALLSNTEAREYLLLTEKYLEPEKALPLYREIIETNCMNADVCYELGRLLLKSGDPGGIDALQIAMDLNEERTTDCCNHIANYMTRQGNIKEAQHYRRIILEHQVNH